MVHIEGRTSTLTVYITRYALSEGKVLKGKIIDIWNLEDDRTHNKRKTYVVQSGERKFLLNDKDFYYSLDEAINKAETMRKEEIALMENRLEHLRNMSFAIM